MPGKVKSHLKLDCRNKIDTQHPCFPSSLRNSHIRLLPLIQGFLIFILCFKLFLNISKNLCIFSERIYFDNKIHVYLNCHTRSYTNLVFRRFNKAAIVRDLPFPSSHTYLFFYFRGGQYVPQVSMLFISNNWFLCKNVSTDLVMF